MQTTLQLNPPTFLWFTADTSIHLTEDNPGPIDVDFSSLSKENQHIIILGIQNRQIKSSTDVKNLMDLYRGSGVSQIITVRELVNVDEETPMIESEQDRKQTAISILGKTAATIKKNIESTQDIRVLRLMLELEVSTRNRKPIISALQDKLNVLFSVVQNIIAKENSPAIRAASYVDPLADAVDITESEVEKITFKLPEETEQ